MYDFLNYAFKGSTTTIPTGTVAVIPIVYESDRDEVTSTKADGSTASLGAQALSSTANFAVGVVGFMLDLAWNGLTTYAVPLAQHAWTGLKTHGPTAVAAAGKGMAWVGESAWAATQWSGKALVTAAEEHHVKERALAAGCEVLNSTRKGLAMLADKAVEDGLPVLAYLKDQAVESGKILLCEAQAGWDRLSGKGSDLNPLQKIELCALAQPEVRPALQASASVAQEVGVAQDSPAAAREANADAVLELDGKAVLPSEPSAESVRPVPLGAAQAWPGSEDLEEDLPGILDSMAPQTEQSQVQQTGHSHWDPEFDFGLGEIHCHIDVHVHVHVHPCIIGAMPYATMPTVAAFG